MGLCVWSSRACLLCATQGQFALLCFAFACVPESLRGQGQGNALPSPRVPPSSVPNEAHLADADYTGLTPGTQPQKMAATYIF